MEFLTTIDIQCDVRVCRVCLRIDVKMFELQSRPLESYFEDIIGMPVVNTMDLPLFLCYECAALVRKFSRFKQSCLQGQATLYNILQTNGKLTEQDVVAVNQNVLLTCHLAICNPGHEEVVVHSDKLEEIKTEPTSLHNYYNGIELKDSVKEENADFAFAVDNFQQSSDDEPLSVHKTAKEEKKEKKRGRKKKKAEVEGSLEINSEFNIASQSDETLVPRVRKKGRPRKNPDCPPPPKRGKKNAAVDDVVNIEDYVTIITLTPEQQAEEINKRKQSSNYLNAAYKCQFCYKGFIDTNAWKHHLGKHDPSAGPVECEVCKFRFASRRALQKHAVNHEKKYACKACDYVSKTTTQAKQHQLWHKGVKYTCEYCDEVSTKWTSYLSHVRIKHPSQHICAVCGYSFVSQLGLSMHKTMMHKNQQDKPASTEEPGPYCADCDVKFVSTEAYNRHMVTSTTHSEGNSFSKGCRVCGARFSSPEELRTHHRAEHARARPKNYGKKINSLDWPQNCTHCGESIENARELWTHYRRAHPDKAYPVQKNYVCDVCGKRFRSNAFLTYHKRTHTTERAYKCTACDKAFFNRTNLSMHQRTHSAARPYPCSACCKAFKCKGALDRHIRGHTGVKPYECEICGKAFSQSNSRKLHVRTVHLKQPAPYSHRVKQEKHKQTDKPANEQQLWYSM